MRSPARTRSALVLGGSILLIAAGCGGSRTARQGELVPFELAPELLSMEAPVYPEAARKAGVEGTVMIRCLVSEGGHVEDLVIIQSVPMLDASAAAAAKTAVFEPAQRQKRPVAVWVVIPIEFKLH